MKRLTVWIILLFALSVPMVTFGQKSDLMEEDWAQIESLSSKKLQQQISPVDIMMSSMDDAAKEQLVRSILTQSDEDLIAKMLWTEDRMNSYAERAAVVWCVFNRLDAWGGSIQSIVTPDQFPGLVYAQKTTAEWATWLVRDVTIRYALELAGYEDVGRTLPKRFLYYEEPVGWTHHVFKTKLKITDPDCIWWDWSMPSPYAD